MELLYDISEMMANLFDGFLGLIFVSLLCGKKKHIKLPLFLVGLVAFAIPLSLLSIFVSAVPIQVFVWLVLLAIFAIVFLDKGIGKKFYAVFIWNVLLMLSNILVVYGMVKIFKWDNEVIVQTGSVQRLLTMIVCKVFLVFMCVLFIYYDNRYSMDYKQWLITIIQFVGTLFIGAIITDLYMKNIFDESNVGELIIMALALFVICIAVCICQHIINKQNQYKLEYEKLRTHLEGEEKNIEKIQELYENSSILRHDIKHYAVMVKELLQKEEYEKIEHIMDDMIEEKLVNDTVLYTSSNMLNAVLNNKLSVCKKYNIRFDVEVSCTIPEEKLLNICVVMANLLDNAIEAEKEEGDKAICCKIKKNKDMLNIYISNNISKSVLEVNPKLITSKNDKSQHGYGTKSIIKRVKEMDGIYNVSEERKKFIIEIFVPCA
ncbi:MAG: GHKL domain-containing protein [Lachnospiraceae bacterium]|nr:GHKL domain-containing protein [Lachnospiraceae bacterium]